MGGLMLQSEYPYIPRKGACALRKERTTVIVKSGYTVTVRDEDELKKLLHQNGPLAIGLHTSDWFGTYRGRVYIPSPGDCPTGSGPNHAMLLVGYSTENGVQYWIIKNSYGEQWGEGGYMKLVRGKIVCSILVYTSGGQVA